MISDEDRRQIEKAFGTRDAGYRGTCNCGKEFFDDGDNGWDWEDGELEGLRANKAAVGLYYAVEQIEVQGRFYCKDCDCWLEMAERLLGFLRGHQSEIGKWYRLEKKRLERAAADVPVIGEVVPRGVRLLLD